MTYSYSKKSVGPIMEPWETSALTRCSCEKFPSRATPSFLLLRKEEKGRISKLNFRKT